MAATTISRATWLDGASGTIIANARLQADIYDKIDALIGNTITFGGTINTEGFGTHSFSAGGTGSNLILVRNSTAGTGNKGVLQAQADGAGVMALEMFSTTHTASGAITAAGGRLVLSGAGTMGIETVASGGIRFYPGGGLRASIDNTNGALAENDFGWRVKNSAGTAIDGVIITSGNEMRIGSDNGAGMSDTVIKAGAAVRFRMNSAERVVMTAGGLLQVADGTASAPAFSFLSNTDDGLYLVTGLNNGPGIARNGTLHTTFKQTSTSARSVEVAFGSFGTGNTGCSLRLGRNDSGAGSAAFLNLDNMNGTARYIWVDNTGNVRTHSTAPGEDGGTTSDTAGTVVGTQTSSRDAKDVMGRYEDRAAALRTVLDTPLYRWRYKKHCGIQGEDFIGIITDESPLFGMDRDVDHPGGKSLNVANAIGLLVAAVQAQQQQIEALTHG